MSIYRPFNEFFQSATFYDCLNRPVAAAMQGTDGTFTTALTQSTNWAGIAVPAFNWAALPPTLMTLTGYDSRGNKTVSIDANGNSTLQMFDGASRPLESDQLMRQNG